MHFSLIDRVLECTPDRVVAVKNVSAAEEYLQDHFPTFPVLPGVLMVEAIVQAGRHLLETHYPACRQTRMVLGNVRGVKYGRFVKPGETLRVEVTLGKALEDGAYEFKGQGTVLTACTGDRGAEADTSSSAILGKFVLRPVRPRRA
jgi:3-hydroxyacyl-[acyl-carrier-protein] dehydratase